jgi:hypothetical protein
MIVYLKKIFFYTEPQAVAQAGLEPMIFLSQPPEYWDYRHMSPRPAPLILLNIGPSLVYAPICFNNVLDCLFLSFIKMAYCVQASGTGDFYSSLLRFIHVMELENIILSEVSLFQKTKNRMFSLICGH